MVVVGVLVAVVLLVVAEVAGVVEVVGVVVCLLETVVVCELVTVIVGVVEVVGVVVCELDGVVGVEVGEVVALGVARISVAMKNFLLGLATAKTRTCTVPAAPATADNKGYELPQSTIAVRSYNTNHGMRVRR